MAPPKNKASNKKSKDTGDVGSTKKSKGAQAVNVRHILVSDRMPCLNDKIARLMLLQCEKFSKKEEALARVRAGERFDEVARIMSEDKARQGMCY